MIAPMKKVWLVVLEKEKQKALKALRRLGVIHIEPLVGKGQEFEETGRRLAEVERAIGLLLTIKAPSQASVPAEIATGLEAATRVGSLAERLRSLQEESSALSKELERVADWGDFEPELARTIGEKGIALRFYEVPAARINLLPEECRYLRLAAPKGKARFAVVDASELSLPPDFVEFSLPALSPAALRKRIEGIRGDIPGVERELAEMVAYLPALKLAQASLAQAFAFEQVRSGMESEGALSYLSGFVPAKDTERLKAAAAAEAWGLLVLEPTLEELPPTKVENGPIVRIIAPVFDFLGTVPNYREYDISGLFLFFFTIFFAMIFGDGGYGMLLLLGGVFFSLKARKKGGRVPDALKLLLVLSTATVAWGLMTGTWFGITGEGLSSFLRALSIPWISSENPQSGTNIKQLCFIIGAVQLIIAHIKNIKRDIGSLKFLAQIGLLMQLMGMYFLVLNFVLDAVRFPMPKFAAYLIGVGFILNFVFANYEGNIFKSILASFANIVSVILGVVNVFADIVSYIRLWAVGLAGLAISSTVNSMAGPLLGKAILFVLGLTLILFGHGLNMALCLLSVVVHGVRLNMLEFSGHLGMEWSGYKYEPFRETAKEEASA